MYINLLDLAIGLVPIILILTFLMIFFGTIKN